RVVAAAGVLVAVGIVDRDRDRIARGDRRAAAAAAEGGRAAGRHRAGGGARLVLAALRVQRVDVGDGERIAALDLEALVAGGRRRREDGREDTREDAGVVARLLESERLRVAGAAADLDRDRLARRRVRVAVPVGDGDRDALIRADRRGDGEAPVRPGPHR